ncbi:MAG: methyltransferase domain-containing protein [Acidobacteriota bacterium]|nr:methyltransferase domain-containing protein [Acidobacteriota bacterium]
MSQTPSEKETLSFQGHSHPLMDIDQFFSLEDYCLRLMHLKAYEEVSKRARDKTVLEIGCNTGYGTKIISGICRRIVGVDLSLNALRVASTQYAGANIDYLLIDGLKLPFADGEFDLVISFQVIEHISNYDTYLSELKRVLSPDGVVVFTTPNARVRLDPGMKPWNEFHVREFLPEELGELLRDWFGQVEIQGLSASEEVYNVEYARVQKRLSEARRNATALLPPYYELRTKIIGGAKSLLPGSAVEQIRKMVRARRADGATQAEPKRLDSSILSKYSTGDFFYRKDNLDSVLDLMAICSQPKT